jgi:hypothetical protein
MLFKHQIASVGVALLLMGCGSPAPDVESNTQDSDVEIAAPESTIAASGTDEGGPFQQLWTTTERADRRTCPAESCGVVGRLMFRESARAYEIRDGWARVSIVYDGACNGGRSEYVDEGDAACTEANGFTEGKFAEWVAMAALSETRPADPAETATAAERVIRNSDDFATHRQAFMRAATQLIQDGRCTARDFEDNGGWTKSVTTYRNEPIYFTYCGGLTSANRIYLDVSTGRIFR